MSIFRNLFYLNREITRVCSWNQPVLSNDGKVSFSNKQQIPLVWLEIATDNAITSQTS